MAPPSANLWIALHAPIHMTWNLHQVQSVSDGTPPELLPLPLRCRRALHRHHLPQRSPAPAAAAALLLDAPGTPHCTARGEPFLEAVTSLHCEMQTARAEGGVDWNIVFFDFPVAQSWARCAGLPLPRVETVECASGLSVPGPWRAGSTALAPRHGALTQPRQGHSLRSFRP